MNADGCDALLVVSFGGPEGPDDVLPFLERVTAGRGVPRPRLLEVAEHYHRFGGVSPINAQNRALVAALEAELAARGWRLPVYWGNRNWHPLLADTLGQMAQDGIGRAVAFVTSAFSSYPGCRQYLDDIERARAEVGDRAPEVGKLRAFYNHPGFVQPMARGVEATLAAVPEERRRSAHLVFTAHSIPVAMARSSDYEAQLQEACRLVCGLLGEPYRWDLVYQSRSGPPVQRWLEPDVGDHLETLAAAGVDDVVIVPIGFVSDHMEVRFDLDVEAAAKADELGLRAHRAPTVGTDPELVAMIVDLVAERGRPERERRRLGRDRPRPDSCPVGCCPRPAQPAQQAQLAQGRPHP
ncbi:MAG TPA: ferrochelatase [Acidimicrobiales bacterium]|nr:ferrochelatase [Acidimicrobiales bacterium]